MLYDGAVTLETQGDPGDQWLEGTIEPDGELVEGAAVYVILNGETYTGTVENSDTGLYFYIADGDSYVCLEDEEVFTCSMDYGSAGENTLKIIQTEE